MAGRDANLSPEAPEYQMQQLKESKKQFKQEEKSRRKEAKKRAKEIESLSLYYRAAVLHEDVSQFLNEE